MRSAYAVCPRISVSLFWKAQRARDTSYGHHYLQWAEPVVAPPRECRPNSWVFRELARRLGLTDEVLFWDAERVARELLSSNHPHLFHEETPGCQAPVVKL